MSATTIALHLEPFDVLFFRGGRPFSAAARASSGLPMPQTLAGAVWTALLQERGCDFHALGRMVSKEGRPFRDAFQELCGAGWIADVRVRGPWLARLCDDTPEVLCPAPAVLHQTKNDAGHGKRLCRLAPLPLGQLPGWQPPENDMRPLSMRNRELTEPAPGYLTPKGLTAFLDGQTPEPGDLVSAEDLFKYDNRTGIEIIPAQLTTKAEGGIFGTSFLALRSAYTARELHEPKRELPPVILYTEIVVPEEAPRTRQVFDGIETLSLGGEGRRVAVHAIPQRFAWSEPPLKGRKPLLLLTTPGLFDTPWRPGCLAGRLAAAAVPGPVAVSGWDLAKGGAKPTRFAAAAGSTYFLDALPDDLPAASVSDHDADRAQGWGCYLRGAWTDE